MISISESKSNRRIAVPSNNLKKKCKWLDLRLSSTISIPAFQMMIKRLSYEPSSSSILPLSMYCIPTTTYVNTSWEYLTEVRASSSNKLESLRLIKGPWHWVLCMRPVIISPDTITEKQQKGRARASWKYWCDKLSKFDSRSPDCHYNLEVIQLYQSALSWAEFQQSPFRYLLNILYRSAQWESMIYFGRSVYNWPDIRKYMAKL
jgi:hypothetical protein